MMADCVEQDMQGACAWKLSTTCCQRCQDCRAGTAVTRHCVSYWLAITTYWVQHLLPQHRPRSNQAGFAVQSLQNQACPTCVHAFTIVNRVLVAHSFDVKDTRQLQVNVCSQASQQGISAASPTGSCTPCIHRLSPISTIWG